MAERSPSSGLLSRLAERNAAPAVAKALPDGCPDALVPAVEAPDLRPADACPSATAASDASDAAPQAAQPDAEDHPALAAAVAEKLVVPAPDAPELDATCPEPKPQLVRWAQPAEAAEPYIQVAARSAARSCAAKESAVQREQVGAARPPVLVRKQALKLATEPAVQHPTPKPEAQLARTAPQAAQAELKPPEAQTPASQSAKELRTEAQPAEPLAA